MKTLIAASIIALSSSAALAESFDFERQLGTPALFPNLVSEQSTIINNAARDGSTSFAYERAIGTPELYPSLAAEGYEGKVLIDDAIVSETWGHYSYSIWGWGFPVGG